MSKYQIFSLAYNSEHLRIDSTDSTMIDWAVNAIKVKEPKCQFNFRVRLGGGVFVKLQLLPLEHGEWIRKHLCENGWEPFAVTFEPDNPTSSLYAYHFRKVVEASE